MQIIYKLGEIITNISRLTSEADDRNASTNFLPTFLCFMSAPMNAQPLLPPLPPHLRNRRNFIINSTHSVENVPTPLLLVSNKQPSLRQSETIKTS